LASEHHTKTHHRPPAKQPSKQAKSPATTAASAQFTKLYSHHFAATHVRNPHIIWRQEQCAPFKELIPSWNLKRPQKGRFVIWMNIRGRTSAGTPRWSGWNRHAELSSTGQKTCGQHKNPVAQIKHVRAELQPGYTGIAFQIKVEARDGAKLQGPISMFCSAINVDKFRIDRACTRKLSSIKPLAVPRIAQSELKHRRYPAMCSPATIAMLAGYWKQKSACPLPHAQLTKKALSMAQAAYDNGLKIYGSWPLSVSEGYNAFAGGPERGRVNFYVDRLENFAALHRLLSRRVPVALSIRGKLPGSVMLHKKGHFMVAVGWDARRRHVICIDPAFTPKQGNVRRYHLEHFLRAWGRSRNLVYVGKPQFLG
jgi:hypothetical protein